MAANPLHPLPWKCRWFNAHGLPVLMALLIFASFGFLGAMELPVPEVAENSPWFTWRRLRYDHTQGIMLGWPGKPRRLFPAAVSIAETWWARGNYRLQTGCPDGATWRVSLHGREDPLGTRAGWLQEGGKARFPALSAVRGIQKAIVNEDDLKGTSRGCRCVIAFGQFFRLKHVVTKAGCI
jgi:hypothetical protein